MTIHKLTFPFITACLLFFAITGAIGCKADGNHVGTPYINPTGQEFPILGTETFNSSSNITYENFKNFKEAGFNISLALLADTNLISQTLNKAKQLGIKVIIHAPQVKRPNDIPQYVSIYKDNPNVAGYYVTDEPTASSFKKWKDITDLILRYDSVHIPYINLLPNVEPSRLQAKNYESYLLDFINLLKPKMFSFDNYPIIKKDGEIVIKEKYFENLEIVAKVSKKTQVPFWAYCLSSPHFSYPYPTKAHLLFQTFSSLAYGAQGMSYYTYSLPYKSKIKFDATPVDSLGNKTKIWYLLKDVNTQIQNLSKVFLNAKLIGVWHTGKEIPIGTNRLKKLPKPFGKIITGNKGVLVSHLNNNDINYLVIVNHDIENPQQISLKRDNYVKRVFPDGKTKVFSQKNFSIEPGGYVIFSW